MISTYFFFVITFNFLYYTQSSQSGYTCEPSVTLTCPKSKIIVILEVTYSTECNEKVNGTSVYAPSRCVGYYRERASTQCNGQESCIIDNSLEQRPSFFMGKQANCAFKGQSINIEYSCVPGFDSSKLPRIDICSSQSLDDIKEGFIHTPNYPNNYPNSLTCSKTLPPPDVSHRLKIYALDFDIESATLTRSTNLVRVNDWLEINDNEEKLYGIRAPYTLLFDDVIEALLMFKSDLANTKRAYHGFLLYFIVTPIRRTRPSTTTKVMTTTESEILLAEESISIVQPKAAGLMRDDRRQNNTGLILLVVLLSGILFIIGCAFLLHKRRNDRRIRYITETFSSFKSKRSKSASLDLSDNGDEKKFDLSSKGTDDKLLSKYPNSGHIYSQDPLDYINFPQKHDDTALIYESIDYDTLPQQTDHHSKPNDNIV